MRSKMLLFIVFVITLTLTGCKGTDETSPVFENVPEVLNFEYGTNVDLLDLGITAEDDFDGDLTSSITINRDKNIFDVGTYDVIYTVSDEAGNSTELSITVVIEDTTAPVIIVNPDGLRTLFEIGADVPNWKLYIDLEDEDYNPTVDYGSRLHIDTTRVDMNKVGPFNVYISFTDIYGNTSSVITITIMMIEIE